MRVEYNKTDLLNLQKRIKKFNDKFDKTETLLRSVATIMYQSVMQNFREEGTDVVKWKPLAPLTIALRRKGRKKASPKILQDTGYLKNSIYPIFTKDMASVGTNVEYAKLHQFGGTSKVPAMFIEPVRKKALRFVIGGKVIFSKYANIPERIAKVPARPFLWLRKEYKERILNLVRRYFMYE